MNTVVEDSKLSKAEAFIRSSLEAKVKDLFPDRGESLQTAIVNATHDAFCLKGSARNSGLEKLIAIGIGNHSDHRALELAAKETMAELGKQGLTAMDLSSVQMLRWSE